MEEQKQFLHGEAVKSLGMFMMVKNLGCLKAVEKVAFFGSNREPLTGWMKSLILHMRVGKL